jgi:enoyl-CoA hydratase/carnithine racemase
LDFKFIIYTKEEGIATITLNRPEALNAFTPLMFDEWVAAIADAKLDNSVRVLVVTGAGRGFCAGADVKAATKRDYTLPLGERNQTRRGVQRLPLSMGDFDKPVIASINGVTVGAGFDSASECDFRIASDKATFAVAHLRMGGISRDAGYWFLTRIIGIPKTLELVFTCRFFDAQEALRLGYVNKVVPHDQLAAATKEFAQLLAKGPPLAQQFAKRLIYEALDVSLEKHCEDVERCQLLLDQTEDYQEGPRAIVEKRPPQFKGR